MVPDEVIWTINCLHYLNYELISCTSGTCYLVCTRNDLRHTVTSYGWCNGITCAVPLFRLFSERFAYIFVCLYVCTTLAHPCRTVRFCFIAAVWTGVAATVWISVSTALAYLCTIFWSMLSRAFAMYKYVPRISVW